MSAEEELMGQDLDRMLRGALIASGQIVDSLARKTQQKLQAAQQAAASTAQEQERAARDAARTEQDSARADERRRRDAEQALREQERARQEQARLVLDRVRSREFWSAADGERVANVVSFATALGEGDQRGEAIYDVVRDRTASLYDIDLDATRTAQPESEEKRRLALHHTIDDHLAEKREREMREQATTVLSRLQKEEFWAEADGAAVAHELAFADTLGSAHEQRKEIYDLVRERTSDLFGVDLDDTLEQFPGSEERGRLALRRSIDEFLASSDTEESREESASLAVTLEARSEVERAADEPQADVTHERSRDAAADAHLHDEERDRLLASSRDHAAVAEAEQDKAEVLVPTTAAGKARQEAAVSYPDGAAEALTKGQQSSSKAATPARVQSRDAGRVRELSR